MIDVFYDSLHMCISIYDIKSFSVFYIICIYIEYLLQNYFFIASFVICKKKWKFKKFILY